MAATLGAAWATPAYDRNGNMISIPAARRSRPTFPAVFDAWNRLVALLTERGRAIYGLRRVSSPRARSGHRRSTRYFFYSSQWQVLDEYVGSTIDRRYVWGLRYVDDLVLRDRGIPERS